MSSKTYLAGEGDHDGRAENGGAVVGFNGDAADELRDLSGGLPSAREDVPLYPVVVVVVVVVGACEVFQIIPRRRVGGLFLRRKRNLIFFAAARWYKSRRCRATTTWTLSTNTSPSIFAAMNMCIDVLATASLMCCKQCSTVLQRDVGETRPRLLPTTI